MRLRLATWNINSVRLRIDQVARFVAEQAPDVLCLQEIKCQEGEFPREAFARMGLPHLAISGQKGWHGVAIASRLPFEPGPRLEVCREGHARCVSIDFYERLTRVAAARDPKAPLIIAGDMNVAPSENDVWSHRQMSRIVSHTPIEIAAMTALKEAGGYIDLVREAYPEPQKLFSWWSYRAQDFRVSNRGLRLDHLWASPGLRQAVSAAGPGAAIVHDTVREWERPSDHVPVTADLAI